MRVQYVQSPEQESPPAWTQEAYRPPRSKYMPCCSSWCTVPLSWPRWWGGVPHSASVLTWDEDGWGGYPMLVMGGYHRYPPPCPDLGPGQREYPMPGYPLPRPGMEYPPSRPGMGYPPCRPEMGNPTSKVVDKVKTLPSVVLRMRAVINCTEKDREWDREQWTLICCSTTHERLCGYAMFTTCGNWSNWEKSWMH